MDESIDRFGRHRVPILNASTLICHVGYMDDDGQWQDLATLQPGEKAMVADASGLIHVFTDHGEMRVVFV